MDIVAGARRMRAAFDRRQPSFFNIYAEPALLKRRRPVIRGAPWLLIVASPAYLERAGTPLLPEDLCLHRIVGGPAASRAASWQFERNGKKVSVDLHPNISTNAITGAIACATGSLGSHRRLCGAVRTN